MTFRSYQRSVAAQQRTVINSLLTLLSLTLQLVELVTSSVLITRLVAPETSLQLYLAYPRVACLLLFPRYIIILIGPASSCTWPTPG